MKAENSRRRRWGTVAFVIILIIVFVWLVDIRLVLEAIRSADWRYLAGAAVVLLIGYMIEAIRIRYLYSNLPPLRFTNDVNNVSNMMNLITLVPVTVIRIFLMREDESVTAARATSSTFLAILFDWILKIVAIMGVILINVRARYLEDYLYLFILILSGLIGCLLLLVGSADKIITTMAPALSRLPFLSEEQSTSILIELAQGLQAIGSRRRLIGALAWTSLTWALGLIFFALALLAFNIDIPLDRLLSSVMFVSVLVNPYSPYLPGVYQVLLLIPLILVSGAAQPKLTALSIVLYVLQLIIWFSLGFIGLGGLDLSLKELRQQITQHLHSVRQRNATDDPMSSQT